MFGGSPKLSSQPQNILVRVASWTWISSPITGSQRASVLIGPPAGSASKPIAASSAWAAASSRFSLNAGPAICRPTGSPSDRPHGIEIAGIPARLTGIVQTSERYIE